MDWLNNLDEKVIIFLENLKNNQSLYSFDPIIEKKYLLNSPLQLGFSCYALKIYQLLGKTKDFDKKIFDDWLLYLYTFQSKNNTFPTNSFIDPNYISNHKILNKDSSLKKVTKQIANSLFNKNFKFEDEKIMNYTWAETKQTISTIYQLGEINKNKFYNFPSSEGEINKFLKAQNWNYPWSSGGQYAGLCLFTKTQLEPSLFEDNRKTLLNFSDELVNSEDGFYYKGKQPSKSELINGAMKILSGIDWINGKIHYPEKLIDFCLRTKVNNEGCDVVDIVYVLYRCSLETNYRKKEIISYLLNLFELIKTHFKDEEGGFSYYKNSCQTNYYDVRFTDSRNQADLHGTVLLIWAIVMILEVLENKLFDYQVIKP